MSDTPRTDALLAALREKSSPEAWCADDTSNFLTLARQLERELNEAKAVIVHDKSLLDEIDRERQSMLIERDQWKAMAQELVKRLSKYQARYHGAEHAQKDWNDANETISRFNELNK